MTVTIRGSPQSQAGPPRGPLSLFCAGTQSLCGGWGLVQALSSFPSSNCMCPFKKTSNEGTLARTATLKLMYSIEQRGWWRNNDFSGGALLPSVLL